MAPPRATLTRVPIGLIVRKDHVGKNQARSEIDDAPAVRRRLALDNGQARHGHLRMKARNKKDPCGAAAADLYLAVTWPVDPQVVDNTQRAGQSDGAPQAGIEMDKVGPRVPIGRLNGPPQRAGTAVIEVGDGKIAGNPSILNERGLNFPGTPPKKNTSNMDDVATSRPGDKAINSRYRIMGKTLGGAKTAGIRGTGSRATPTNIFFPKPAYCHMLPGLEKSCSQRQNRGFAGFSESPGKTSAMISQFAPTRPECHDRTRWPDRP